MFRTLVLISVFLVGNELLSAQSVPETCPQIEVTVPLGTNMRGGDTHYITISTKALSLDLESLKYKWTLPDGFSFEGQGKPYISFVVTDAMDGREVKVWVEVEGLPANCPSEASATFSVGINPGFPLVLDEYESLSVNEERSRLTALIEELKRLREAKALIFINYKRTDSQKSVIGRASRIVAVLSGKHKLPLDSFAFVFAETGLRRTRVYAWSSDWPSGVYSPTNYQEFKIKRQVRNR